MSYLWNRPVITPDEQAEMAGVSRRTLDRWAKTRPLLEKTAPSFPVGKRASCRFTQDYLKFLDLIGREPA